MNEIENNGNGTAYNPDMKFDNINSFLFYLKSLDGTVMIDPKFLVKKEGIIPQEKPIGISLTTLIKYLSEIKDKQDERDSINKADKYFIKNLNNIVDKGHWDINPRAKYRDGTDANSKFITQVFEEYDISKGEFPITTLRDTAITIGIREILWIYQKQTSSLQTAWEMGIHWWDSWNIGDDTIGQRYGATVKKWGLIDKLLVSLIKEPFSRRHIMNMYQEQDLIETKGLFPCAYETIWSVRKNDKDDKLFLDMTLIQRSNDYIVAGYINKIQYVALMMMVAGHCGYEVGKFCHLVQNLHIYDRHIHAALEILNKKPLDIKPKIVLKQKRHFYDYTIDDFEIINTEGIKKIKSKLELGI